MSVQDLLNPDTAAGDVKIIWRKRDETSSIKLKSVLADTRCHPGDAAVNAGTGFYVVEPGESVIFVSALPKGAGSGYLGFDGIIAADTVPAEPFKVELVVFRGVAQSSTHSEALYEWASSVVAQACRDRRNVRVRSTSYADY